MVKKYILLLVLFVFLLKVNAQSPGQSYLEFSADSNTRDVVTTAFTGVVGTASRTVEAWVKLKKGYTQICYIADWGENSKGKRYTISLIGGAPRVEVQGNGKTIDKKINDGNWHHIATVYNLNAETNKHIIYVDGIQEWTGDLTQEVNTSKNGVLKLGVRSGDSGSPLVAGIDEVRVWDDVRTVTEINENMHIELTGTEADLVAYYKFNEGNGQVVNDTSTNGNNGYLGLDNSENTANDPSWASGLKANTEKIGHVDYEVTLVNDQLSVLANFEVKSIEIFDLLGNSIYSAPMGLKSAVFKVEDLKDGMYLVSLYNADGDVEVVKLTK